MRKAVINMCNYILGEAVKIAMEHSGSFQVTVVERPQETAKKCHSLAADVALMEVTSAAPCLLEERLRSRDEIKRSCPDCKVVLLVDENSDRQVAERIKQAKCDGLIDQFVYGSTSASYLVALLETL